MHLLSLLVHVDHPGLPRTLASAHPLFPKYAGDTSANLAIRAIGWRFPKMDRLFTSSEVFVANQPEENGFYDLELPDAYRWMKQEAHCLLPSENIARLENPVLRITANTARSERFLSVYINGDFLGTQRIDRYGSYYFYLPPEPLNKSGDTEIALRVDRAEPVEGDPRTLGIPIYGIDAIDLNSGWDGFDERRYLADQLRVFKASEFPLAGLLERRGIGPGSLILDIGAGMGWSTALLAARTGAKVFGVDLHQYDSYTGDSFRGELLKRLKRHLPPLLQEPGFERFQSPEQVVDTCTFFTMNAQQLLFRENLFDLVFSLNAFEHIPDPGQALQEISRVLKSGGHVFLQFNGLYFSDAGHHLYGLADLPWVHLLHDRAEIKKIVREAGKAPNEVDNILNTLNGYSVRQFLEIFDKIDLKIEEKIIHKGFFMGGSEQSEEFKVLKEKYPEEDLTTSGMTVILRKDSNPTNGMAESQGRNKIVKPFNFKANQDYWHCTSSLVENSEVRKEKKFIVPEWFKRYFHPDEESMKYWQQQYELAKQHKEYQLPDFRMRMPSDKLHQLMAKEFWKEVPKDFYTILDVGCSDGYMVKVFKEAGKEAVGINDFLYPTDKLFLEEYDLKVYEMDMHCMDFEDESFDAVWCRHTLEHSFAPLQVLAEIYRVTKENGYLFAVLPPPPQPEESFDGHWHQIPQYQFKYLLEMCQFTIIDMRTSYFSYKRENDNLEIRAICRKNGD
jgi:SAM-dependent methyltransferase